MKFLGLTVELPGRKNKRPLEITTKQPPTLIMAVVEHMKHHADWKVKIQYISKENLAAGTALTTTVGEFYRVAETIEDFIRERFGAADWRVVIYNPSGERVASYDVSVAGPKPYKPAGIGIHVTQDGEKKKTSSTVEDFVALAGALKVLMPEPDTSMKELTMELVKGNLQGGSSESDIFMREMATVSVNNAIGEKESEFDRMKSMIELTRMLSPNVPEETIATALIGALPGIAQVFASAKGASAAPQGVIAPHQAPALQQNNGGVDVTALRALAESIPSEMIAGLPPDQQRAVQQLLNTPTPEPQAGVTLPRPGDDINAAGGMASVTSPNVSEVAPQATGQNPHHVAIDAMVDQIRVDLRGAATDRQVAEKMLAMITAARGFTSEQPHVLLKGIMEASEETVEAEFRLFCQAIPELGRDYKRIERIEQETINIMKEGAVETQSAIEQNEAQDDLNFAYDTEAQERDDVSRSAGIQEDGTEGSVGPEQDRDVDQAARETERYEAKAV